MKTLWTKIIVGLFIIFTTTVFSNAKTYTTEGVYTGSRCGDLCYMNFKTNRGNLSLYGYIEDHKNVYKGKKYKITYKTNVKIAVAELGKIKVNDLIKIIPISQKKTSSKKKGKYLSYIKKECKSFGPPYCYLAKRYTLFQKECNKGDRVSCKNIIDVDTAIRTKDLQGIHYLSNSMKTGRGK
jgi:hypothetical protein